MGHREEAESRLKQAHSALWKHAPTYASMAAAHAALALLDYFQEHDGDELGFDPASPQVIILQNRIRDLEVELAGARTALRARDEEIIEGNRGNERE